MLTVKEIMDGVNTILVRLYPDRTVYTDVIPEKFEPDRCIFAARRARLRRPQADRRPY